MVEFVYIMPWWVLKLRIIGACLGALLLLVYFVLFGTEQSVFGYHQMAIVWLFLGGMAIAFGHLAIQTIASVKRSNKSKKRNAHWKMLQSQRPRGLSDNENSIRGAAEFAEAMRLYPNK